jgi:hypothetical protein
MPSEHARADVADQRGQDPARQSRTGPTAQRPHHDASQQDETDQPEGNE